MLVSAIDLCTSLFSYKFWEALSELLKFWEAYRNAQLENANWEEPASLLKSFWEEYENHLRTSNPYRNVMRIVASGSAADSVNLCTFNLQNYHTLYGEACSAWCTILHCVCTRCMHQMYAYQSMPASCQAMLLWLPAQYAHSTKLWCCKDNRGYPQSVLCLAVSNFAASGWQSAA